MGQLLTKVPVVRATRHAASSAAESLLVVAGTSRVEAFEGPRGRTGP